jgi:hypothetical protein
MSVSFNPAPDLQEYASKTELHYGLRQPFHYIARVIRDDNLAAHLIDGVIKYKVEEVVNGLNKRFTRSDYYARR